jgi:hypothetical protein
MNLWRNLLVPVLGLGALLSAAMLLQPARAATPGFDGALTITTANQIINQYADLTAIDTVAKTITVDNITNLLSGAPVNGGQVSVLVDDNNVGEYQFLTVGSVAGNVITLASECGALTAFDANHTEVIRVP